MQYISLYKISNSCHVVFRLLFWKWNARIAVLAVEATHIDIWKAGKIGKSNDLTVYHSIWAGQYKILDIAQTK